MCVSDSVMSDSWPPHGLEPTGFSIHGIFQTRIVKWFSFHSPADLPNLGMEAGSPALQTDCLLSEPIESKEFVCNVLLYKHIDHIYIHKAAVLFTCFETLFSA